jgi:hypothetical protein
MANPTVDLRPGKLDIKVSRGDTDGIPIVIREGGVPADLTGRSYAAQIRKTKDAITAVEITVDTTDADTGELVLRLEPAVTETLTGEYQWDLEQTIGGSVRTILGGRWIFDPDVTREAP